MSYQDFDDDAWDEFVQKYQISVVAVTTYRFADAELVQSLEWLGLTETDVYYILNMNLPLNNSGLEYLKTRTVKQICKDEVKITLYVVKSSTVFELQKAYSVLDIGTTVTHNVPVTVEEMDAIKSGNVLNVETLETVLALSTENIDASVDGTAGKVWSKMLSDIIVSSKQ